MIIVKFYGGLGNQMYQFSLLTILKELYPDQTVKADISHYNILTEHNGFELEKNFLIDVDIASNIDIKKISCGFVPSKLFIKLPYKVRYAFAHKQNYFRQINGIFHRNKKLNRIGGINHNTYLDLIFHLNSNNDFYFDGLWQNMQYFDGYEEKIKKIFTYKRELPKEDQLIRNRMVNSNSVSIHVRRGDFINSKFDICGMSYYLRALEIAKLNLESPHFYFFTDDPDFVNEEFSFLSQKTVISHSVEDSIFDMELMGCCKINIISNSTFSFWGAYLNTVNSSVICPKFSLRDNKGSYEMSVPNDWIIIDPFIDDKKIDAQ